MQAGRLTAVFAAVLAAAGCVCSDGGTNRINITSYNIRHCAGPDGKVRLQKVADVIVQEKPDFVALNEVDCKTKRSGNVDEAVELGKLAGFHATFAKAIPYEGGEYGNAVLSRERPMSVEIVPLPGSEPRVLLLCEFKDFWFGTAHLDFGRNQLKSVPVIRNAIAEKASGKPVFFTGDWNATPNSKTLDALREFMTVVSKEDSLTFHGYRKHPPEHKYCIDYIAVDKSHERLFTVKDAHVTSHHDVSDHNPVSVTLERR